MKLVAAVYDCFFECWSLLLKCAISIC